MDTAVFEATSKEQAEEYKAALAGCSDDELKQMGNRLKRSCADMTEMLSDLEAERDELRQDNADVGETIGLMHQEIQKLDIGSTNCVEPTLMEGPADFLNRYWERLRPRDNAYLAAEHVGELTRISGEEDVNPVVQVKKSLQQAAEPLSTSVAPLIQKAGERGHELKESHLDPLMEKASAARREITESHLRPLMQKAGEARQEIRESGLGPIMRRAGGLLKDELSLAPRSQNGDGKQSGVKEGNEQPAVASEATSPQQSSSPSGYAAAGQQALSNLSGAVGPWMRKAGSFLKEELSLKPQEASPKQKKAKKEKKTKKSAAGDVVLFDSANDAPGSESAASSERSPIPDGDPFMMEDSAPASSSADGALTPSSEALARVPDESNSATSSIIEVAKTQDLTAASQAVALEPQAAPREEAPATSAPVGEEPADSTESLLVEATITVEDGKVLIMRIMAADRIKNVAKQFVKDNSLDTKCVDALTKWLKKAENDAEAYPIRIEGELKTLCETHGS